MPPKVSKCGFVLVVAVGAAFARGAEPATRPAVPVVYVSYGLPAPLSAGETDLILRAAGDARPEGRELWFVAVQHNGPRECWAMACYTPERQSGGLKWGRFAAVRLRKERVVDGGVVREVRESLESVDVRRYVQVARAFETGDGRETPAAWELPFEVPRPRGHQPAMQEGEIVRLVAAARKALKAERGDPVCSVRMGGLDRAEANSPDLFIVCIGVEHWGGKYVEARRAGVEFEALRTGEWQGELLSD